MWLVQFYRSTIGKKVIMAVTGLIGIGFVIGHMAGNLQAFIGRDKLNAYGALLHGPLGELRLICSETFLTIPAFVLSKSSRDIPGFRAMPAVMTTRSDPLVSS